MGEVAIRVEGLGKRYQLGEQVDLTTSFREMLMDLPRKWAKAARHGVRRAEGPSGADVEFWALRDINLQVAPGEVLGIIGQNGAGKSTLLKILSRITNPSEGRAEIHGRVGSLLEVGTGFHPELTGRENVYMNGAILGMRKREIDAKFDEIVAFAGVEAFLDTPIKRFSSGMRVRLAFAVAAHLEPEIMIVDEVLAVGDASFQRKCIGKMGEVARSGRTVLFVSHNLASVQMLCDRCVLLSHGRKEMEGETSEVVAHYLHTEYKSSEVVFDEQTARDGAGKVRYRKVRLFNEQGRRVNAIAMGEGLTVELIFEVNDPPLRYPTFDVIINSPLGQPLLSLSSWQTHGQMPDSERGGAVRLHIERLDLLPGHYTVAISISQDSQLQDRIHRAINFDVTPRAVYPTGKLPKSHEAVMFAPLKWTSDYQ